MSMTVEVADVGYGGLGVARTDDGVVFVPGCFTGETVEVEILTKKKRFAIGKLLRIVTPSPSRIEPTLSVPGMVYAALDYPAELALKQHQLEALLGRIGRLDDLSFLKPPVAAPKTEHYRNKLTLRWDGKRLGYIGDDNVTVVNTLECPLSEAPINDLLKQLRADKIALKSLKKGQRVTFRYTPTDGVVVGLGEPPAGKLTENIAGLSLTVAAEAFFQVNPAAAERLLTAFRAGVGDAKRVFDLYCGCGLFGFVAAQAGATDIFGLETTPGAVESAAYNAKVLNVRGEYRCASAECIPDAVPAADLWIVDPPRDGLLPEVRKELLERRPPRVAYISCGPDTLARDLNELKQAYRIDSMQLFDFFPRTAHFETLTFLTRIN